MDFNGPVLFPLLDNSLSLILNPPLCLLLVRLAEARAFTLSAENLPRAATYCIALILKAKTTGTVLTKLHIF